ncbi:hypothetical protein ACL02R_11135 [Streptomyces sp. MS19]|uniref:hypothetical protein n=1 Tax=Streptomyces sp. MS19 TaxID=3385972 RepID=UPI0039A3CF91
MTGTHIGAADGAATRAVFELSAEGAHFGALEEALTAIDVPGVSFHESDPASPALLTSGWQTLVVSAVSAGALKAVRDVLIAHISGKRVRISVTRSGTKRSVTYEGHLGDRREVEQLVREITAEEPSD